MIEIDTSIVAASIDQIRLVHMNKDVDHTRFLVEDYPEAARDLCLFIVQTYYKMILAKAPDGLGPAAKERALSMAKWQATRRITTELKGLVDRSTLFLLMDAEESKWYNDMEYTDLEELLASIYEGKEGQNEAYDWKFIIDTLIPAAIQAKIPSKLIANASLHVKKLRGMVPAARELLQQQENNTITPQEAMETLNTWLSDVASPSVTYDAFRETVDQWRGHSMGRAKPIEGYMMMSPDGKFWLVVPTQTDKDVAIVEQALKNRVNLRVTGIDWLINMVLGMMKIKK